MRTRASGPASPPSSPPRPHTGSTNKRRRSTSHSSNHQDAEDASEEPRLPTGLNEDTEEHSNTTGFLTPRKAKRVRFSEPIHALYSRGSNNSTGLTPSMRRTRLLSDDEGALLRRKPSRLHGLRRMTMPPRLESNEVASPIVQEIQYAPLRQVLDDRMRRRLRRNHLSEEVNEIDNHRRDDQRQRKAEIDKLRAQGDQSDAKIKNLMFELESQRQLGIQLGTEEEQHAQALREELERLRHDLAVRNEAEEERRRIEGSPTEFDSDEDLWNDQVDAISPLQGGFDTSSSSPAMRGASPLPPSSPPADAAVQTSFPSSPFMDTAVVRSTFNTEMSYESHDLSEQLADAQRQASDARAALHFLHGELLALGFNDGTATSEQLVQSIKDAFRQARLDLEHLLPGETPGGFENVLLLPAMLDHVRKVLARAGEYRKAADLSAQSESAMRNHFDITLEKLQHAENDKTILIGQRQNAVAEVQRKDQRVRDLELAADARAGLISERDQIIEKLEKDADSAREDATTKTSHIRQLEEEVGDQTVAVRRLQSALDSYRAEVTSLETLVSTLEQQKEQAESSAAASNGHATAQKRRVDQLTQTLTEVTGFVEHHLGKLKDDTEQHRDGHGKAFDEAKAFIESQLSALKQ